MRSPHHDAKGQAENERLQNEDHFQDGRPDPHCDLFEKDESGFNSAPRRAKDAKRAFRRFRGLSECRKIDERRFKKKKRRKKEERRRRGKAERMGHQKKERPIPHGLRNLHYALRKTFKI